MGIRILCTLGPASLEPEIVSRLDEAGVDLFRINMSHASLSAFRAAVDLVRSASSKPICLDTEGPQVRCGVMEPGVELHAGEAVDLTADEIVGTAARFTLRPVATFEALQAGSVLSVDFDGAVLQVMTAERRAARAVVIEPGLVRSNKAVVVQPEPELPTFTDKDLTAIGMGSALGITEYAVSFARDAADVAHMRSLVPPGSFVIAKIESRPGIRHMDSIIAAADAVLIDRGDLSMQVALEQVPFYQKAMVRLANLCTKPVYVATNLLESMTVNRRPTVAEANDIANTLMDGVHGLVLAAETAIGIDPVGSVQMVNRLVETFTRRSRLVDVESGLPDDVFPWPLAPMPAGRTNGAQALAGRP